MSESELVCVGMTSNPALAHLWCNALENEGIACRVVESTMRWIDSIPWAQAEIQVHRPNADKARAILGGRLPADSPPLPARR